MTAGGGLISLIYVSRGLIERAAQESEIEKIVEGSIERNARLRVRGALLFTEENFSQLLEGPEECVDEVMASILRDRRHEHVMVIERKPLRRYRFPDWGLVYWGNARYMDLKIGEIREVWDRELLDRKAAEIFELMRLLANASREGGKPIGVRSSLRRSET